MSSGAQALLAKYRSLLRKHQALVQRVAARTMERFSTWKLYAWALEASASGLAVLREGMLQVSNARWHALGRSAGAGWRRLASGEPEGPPRRSMRELAQAESRAVLTPGAPPGPRSTRYRREDGEQVLEVRTERVGPLRESFVLVLVHDVTAQVRAEEELERARVELARREHLQALGEMASGIGHDLHTTLHAMRLRLELLQRDTAFAGPEAREHLEALLRIVADAGTRLGHLRDFARQRPEPPEERVQLADVVREAVELARGDLEHRAAREGLSVRLVVEVPELPRVSGSAAELRYVLLNLLLNARDAMPRGGTVRVRGRHEAGQVRLTVEDEGTGIPEAHLHNIFRPFFTTKGSRGTGLGLSMAYGVVSRVGGSITAANRAGGGAIFTLTFPALPSTLKPPTRTRTPRPSPQ